MSIRVLLIRSGVFAAKHVVAALNALPFPFVDCCRTSQIKIDEISTTAAPSISFRGVPLESFTSVLIAGFPETNSVDDDAFSLTEWHAVLVAALMFGRAKVINSSIVLSLHGVLWSGCQLEEALERAGWSFPTRRMKFGNDGSVTEETPTLTLPRYRACITPGTIAFDPTDRLFLDIMPSLESLFSATSICFEKEGIDIASLDFTVADGVPVCIRQDFGLPVWTGDRLSRILRDVII